MEPYNFKEKIQAYIHANHNLSSEMLGVLLFIDNLYQEIPIDLSEVRRINTYLDPKNIKEANIDQITILRLASENISDQELRNRLNAYLDMKYSCRGYTNTYKENMKQFKKDTIVAERFLEQLLKTASLPDEVQKILYEHPALHNKDLFDLVQLYKTTTEPRIKYEILRKIGIIDILTRIRKSYPLKYIDYVAGEVFSVFAKGLGVTKIPNEPLYFWIDENEKVQVSRSEEQAQILHNRATHGRKMRALRTYPIQVFKGKPARTQQGNLILNMEVRNKLRRDGKIYYSSSLEKMIRKNLEFPLQMHDIIGMRLVVENQEDIIPLIAELETIIGGASLRKKEKNSTNVAIHKFDRQPISKYSSKEYYVWKAVYDVALKSSIIPELRHIKNSSRDSKIKELIDTKIKHYMKHPVNVVVEVQIQDLKSYLLSIAEGSPTDHEKLKMKQIRANSFYKVFPKEIYKPILFKERDRILQSSLN
jgi:hypothetical protein